MSDDLLDDILGEKGDVQETATQNEGGNVSDAVNAVERSIQTAEVSTESPLNKTATEYVPGCGVDIGTSNIVVARRTKDGTYENRFHRNMLYPLDISEEAMDLLEKSSYLYVKVGDKYFVVGEDALTLVNAIGKGEVVRPMQDGILNPSLKESTELLFYIIKAVVGDPIVEGESLRFSVPADPVDSAINNKFHEMILMNFFKKMGYDAKPVNEAMCVAYDCNPVMKEDGAEVPLSGISMSCLTPDMPIVTNKGILQISEVEKGTRVLTRGGTYERVLETVPTHIDKNIQNIVFYSSNMPLKITSDHEIFIKRDGEEAWIDAGSARQGDWVMMPSVKFIEKENYIRFQQNITSSKGENIKLVKVSERIAKFIGLFLGDGHVRLKNGGVFFDFGANETYLCEFVQGVADDIFKNSMSFIKKGDNCTRCQMNNKGLAKWLKENCYEDGKKVLPFEIDSLTRSARLGFLSGLLESDGSFGSERISFENTSSNLTSVFMQLCNAEGMAGSYSERTRINEHLEGKPISKSYCFTLNENYVPTMNYLFRNSIDKHSTRNFVEMVQWNRVRKNDVMHYKGTVYDLKVENDHSFCVPGCCVHNCGGGMTNVALSYKGLALQEFSITKSGDYIDEQSAMMTGSKKNKVIKIKEKQLDLNNVDMSDRIQSALSVYYEEMMERMIYHVAERFKDSDSEMDGEIEVVVAGGTSMAPGFCDKLAQIIKESSIPFDVYRVRHSETPFYSVSQGACIRAQADYKKKTK